MQEFLFETCTGWIILIVTAIVSYFDTSIVESRKGKDEEKSIKNKLTVCRIVMTVIAFAFMVYAIVRLLIK